MTTKTEGKTTLVGIKVKASTRKKLESKAKRSDRTLSYVANQIIEKYFEEKSK